MTENKPLVSIIIPAFNKWAYTAKSLQALQRNTLGCPYETIVVDNASSDETPRGLCQFPNVRAQRNEINLGFAKACNQGARLALGRFLLFLNNDTEVQANWLPPMLELLDEDPSIAVVGSKLLFPNGTIQHGGVTLAYGAPYPIAPSHLHYCQAAETSQRTLELSAVTGACLLIRSEAFHQVGGFDEGFRNGYEDVDLCLKVKAAGLRIVYTPKSVVVHHESVSQGRFERERANLDLLHRRWLGKFNEFDLMSVPAVPPALPAPNRPSVSLVVVTQNSLESIAPCLHSLAVNLGAQDEIIVADCGSTDCTFQFVELFSHQHNHLPLKVLPSNAEADLEKTLQKALVVSNKDYVLVLHANMRLPLEWLNRLCACFLPDRAIGAVGVTGEDTGLCVIIRRSALGKLGLKKAKQLFTSDSKTAAQMLHGRGLKFITAHDAALRPIVPPTASRPRV